MSSYSLTRQAYCGYRVTRGEVRILRVLHGARDAAAFAVLEELSD